MNAKKIRVTKKARDLFERAVALIESDNIRKWATSNHNKPHWLNYTQAIVTKQGMTEPLRLATYITLTAMG